MIAASPLYSIHMNTKRHKKSGKIFLTQNPIV
jgi:hypothetical protein